MKSFHTSHLKLQSEGLKKIFIWHLLANRCVEKYFGKAVKEASEKASLFVYFYSACL